ncbi:MAG: ArsR/SmtB family transcription factor [bacterium]
MAGAEGTERVWKALSDPTRRKILDLLKGGPRTTGDLAEAFPSVSRFAVMKHLAVLEGASLILVDRRGRERWNYLNPVPIRQIYERWISDYQGLWAGSLLKLKRHIEQSHERSGRS